MKLHSLVIPYLLLVSFYTPRLNHLTAKDIQAINHSPYNGIAVPLIWQDNANPLNFSLFSASIGYIRKKCKKNILPWVFFNRFYGYYNKNKAASVPYFKKIQGMDLYNKTGALGDFYRIWGFALTAALKLKSPGIVVDMEDYNDETGHDYNLKYLAKTLNQPVDQVKRRLEAIGSHLVEIANKQYPHACIWFLYSGLGNPQIKKFDYLTPTYFVIGMLKEAKALHSKLQFVSGGELSLAYCSSSVSDLRRKILERFMFLKPWMMMYPNLHLAGTIAPWNNRELKRGFFAKGVCGHAPFSNLNDFQPIFHELFYWYRYIWIYAAWGDRYNPYDDKIAMPYNKALQQAKQTFWK